MKFSLFYHSLVSDWNHGNAHFLRGIVSELLERGHDVQVYEPANGWSKASLIEEQGLQPITAFHQAYPHLQLRSRFYAQGTLDLEQVAEDSDVVIVHEWNEPWLVNAFGELRNRIQYGSNRGQPFVLLFHDTHHRAVSDPEWIKRFNLEHYNGILAFGEILTNVYHAHGWSQSVWTWHEAADIRVFYPREPSLDFPSGDVVWIGNWGDDERTRELETFLFEPIRNLELHAHIYGVRYPQLVLDQLEADGISHCGWLPNFHAPKVFANHSVTVHVPRRFYAETLPGIPTIRPFEAMACGIPLISAPWQDSENLFTPGKDFLVARNTEQMEKHLHTILNDKDFARDLANQARSTILSKHTCGHRVDQLLTLIGELGVGTAMTYSHTTAQQQSMGR